MIRSQSGDMKAAEGEVNTADDGSNLDFAQNDRKALEFGHKPCMSLVKKPLMEKR